MINDLQNKINLRPYQIGAIEAILADYNNYESPLYRLLLVLPTGAGKTVVISALLSTMRARMHHRRNFRTLFIAHREELIVQAARTLVRFGFHTTTCCGGKNDVSGNVVVSTVQSLSKKRLEALESYGNIDQIVIDEAHHTPAKSYMSVLSYFGVFDDKPRCALVGCTATPNRTDRVALRKIYQKISYKMSIAQLIKLGHLSPVSGHAITLPTPSDLVVRTIAGDFAQGDLECLDTDDRNRIIVNRFRGLCGGKKAIAFCISVNHAKALADMFCSDGIEARAIYGDMDDHYRHAYLQDFREGKIQVLTSRDVLTEGYDEPTVECVIMARPTKSKTVYVQAVGRGLRVCEGKSNCMVLDFCYQGHTLSQAYSLGRIIPTADVVRDTAKKDEEDLPLEEGGKKVGKKKIMRKKIGAVQVDMLTCNDYAWSLVCRGVLGTAAAGFSSGKCAVFILCEDPDMIRIQAIKRDVGDENKPAYEICSEMIADNVEDAINDASAWIKSNMDMKFREKWSLQSDHPVTEKQLDLFVKLFPDKEPIPANTTMGDFTKLMVDRDCRRIWDALTAPVTQKQAAYIKKIGHVVPQTRCEASRLIDDFIKKALPR